MADRNIIERLQPSLLDRLTDEEPGKSEESRDQRVIDIRRLREIVQRDLSWLLNTNNAEPWVDPERHPNAAASVLNYGIIDMSGTFSTGNRVEEVRASILRSIELFEPRLRSETVHIEFQKARTSNDAIIAFEIRADMWAEPVPLELYLRSEIDVTTGSVQIERIG